VVRDLTLRARVTELAADTGKNVDLWAEQHSGLGEDLRRLSPHHRTPAPRHDKCMPRVRMLTSSSVSHRTACRRSSSHKSELLERGGWHRAAIFRKVRRFRATYGAHPRIQLDLDTARSDQISRQIEVARLPRRESARGVPVHVLHQGTDVARNLEKALRKTVGQY
jgi:hypothetical protein